MISRLHFEKNLIFLENENKKIQKLASEYPPCTHHIRTEYPLVILNSPNRQAHHNTKHYLKCLKYKLFNTPAGQINTNQHVHRLERN